jgi:hypothetical protein
LHKRGLEANGKEHYNVEIYHVYHDKRSHGVVSEDGKKITLMDGNNFEFMDEEAKIKTIKIQQKVLQIATILNLIRWESLYGLLLWQGKTTTARLLQEKQGFVNYEGDCFLKGLNPYVGPAPEGLIHSHLHVGQFISSYFNCLAWPRLNLKPYIVKYRERVTHYSPPPPQGGQFPLPKS